MKRKSLIVSICLVLLLVFSTVKVEARGCFNPLFLPFAVVGAVVGTVAVATTALVPVPAYPAYVGPSYYAPGPVCCGPGPAPHRRGWGGGPPHPPDGYWGPRYRR